ncbi:hypothetical protein RRF57_010898 [Xylaria bambusicola]|uniref:Uncharacterized protein n=1 Tax=Xylaria bambusicola TaxID=326684 RepID=A0AAN7UYR7_9PEZI
MSKTLLLTPGLTRPTLASFFAFANSKPTPPPYTFSPESSDASTEGSAETTCSERNQSIITFVDTDTHSIYSGSGITEDALSFQDDDDGDGNYDSDGNDDTDDDGEGDGEDSPSGETVVGDDKIPEKKPVFTRVRALYTITINTMKSKSERVKTLFTTMKAEFKRVEAAHNARRKWLAFWAEGASYRLKLRRQTLAIYVRLYLRRIFARLRPILLKAFAAFVMAMILSQMAPLFPGWLDDDDDIFDGEIAYYLVDEDRRWSAAS